MLKRKLKNFVQGKEVCFFNFCWIRELVHQISSKSNLENFTLVKMNRVNVFKTYLNISNAKCFIWYVYLFSFERLHLQRLQYSRQSLMFDFYKIFWFMPDSVKKDITVTITLFHFFTYMYNSVIFSQKFINKHLALLMFGLEKFH
jgi:hypothetical protein